MAEAVARAMLQARQDGHEPAYVAIKADHWRLLNMPIIAFRPAPRAYDSVLWAHSRDGMRLRPYPLVLV